MSNLDLMRKRIEHNRNKQQEDYEKELALRLAKKGIRYAPSSGVCAAGRKPSTSYTSGK